MVIIVPFLKGWIPAALLTTVLGVIFQTQNVIARLSNIGADIGLGQRLSMTTYDVFHLGLVYVVFIGLATLGAYLAGLLVYRLAGFGRTIIFVVAGAVAILVMLLLMKQAFFGVHLIAGARDVLGISLQMLAGAVGGLVFAWLTASRKAGFSEAS